MPTFATTPRFRRDYDKLNSEQKERFRRIVREQFVLDVAAGGFRKSLRVKGVQGAPGVFEMTWAPNGRATCQYGTEIQAGEPHIVWRRIGTHAIFEPAPP